MTRLPLRSCLDGPGTNPTWMRHGRSFSHKLSVHPIASRGSPELLSTRAADNAPWKLENNLQGPDNFASAN